MQQDFGRRESKLTLKFLTWQWNGGRRDLSPKDKAQEEELGFLDLRVGVEGSDDFQFRHVGFEEHVRCPGGSGSQGHREMWAGEDS